MKIEIDGMVYVIEHSGVGYCETCKVKDCPKVLRTICAAINIKVVHAERKIYRSCEKFEKFEGDLCSAFIDSTWVDATIYDNDKVHWFVNVDGKKLKTTQIRKRATREMTIKELYDEGIIPKDVVVVDA